MDVRVVVPRRADGGHRDVLWAHCAPQWRWPIVEGHHDDGPFNRSTAINRGAAGSWDVAVIADADVLVDQDQVAAGIDIAARTGRMVLPFLDRALLSADGTRRVVEFDAAPSQRWATHIERNHVSSCVIVHRSLWDAVGGFDERFVGWGAEDNAFERACAALRSVERLRGRVWHLWHPPAPWRDHRSANYRMACALLKRYQAADGDAMGRLLAEPRDPDQVVVVCLTNGRRDTLAKTLHSADEMLRGPIGRKVIAHDPSGGRLGDVPAGWDVEQIRGGGYPQAVQGAIDVAIGSGQPWVFFLEDDFTFNEPVDVAAMTAILRSHPELVQVTLKRQAWYEHELAAGGIIESKPEAFTQRAGYVEHRDYWSQNPMVTSRALLAAHLWPKVSGSERRFGDNLFSDLSVKAAILGDVTDPPRVTHVGAERAGRGY